MKTYLFTFGQSHVHRVNGFTYDCDVVCAIKAEDHEAARGIAFTHFGDKFATSYEDGKLSMEYFPRGIKELN